MNARRYPVVTGYSMREVGEKIPEPHTSVDYVEVAAA